MECYSRYKMLQEIREAIDSRISNTKKWKKGKKEAIETFRGIGAPEGGDMLYGSMYETSLPNETLVGLQEKLLFLLEVLQSADARPTSQTQEAVAKVSTRADEMVSRWNGLK
jgi:hypothetical protein